jgi:ABC-type transport system involved in cytochrome bd biosynthesis fused ATPase/permease subunit
VDHGATLSSLRGIIIALAAVLAGRALIAWATEAASYRASAAVKSQLRRQVLARAAALGPRWLAGRRSAELTALATEGIDALDGYFSRYLPQLILAVIVPVAVLIRVGAADLLSGVIILVTLPLIPLFGALVGMAAGAYARRRWEALARLSHHFLDVVTGLPTLARPDASPGELRDALRRARLLDWVDSLPSGLATPVGEHGAQLSGGQRQRLALARVLLADFPVVVLDEPTEHLDDDTARELTRDLLAATRGRTRLLITHRPVNAAEVDQIVRLGPTRPMETTPRALVPTGPVTAAV